MMSCPVNSMCGSRCDVSILNADGNNNSGWGGHRIRNTFFEKCVKNLFRSVGKIPFVLTIRENFSVLYKFIFLKRVNPVYPCWLLLFISGVIEFSKSLDFFTGGIRQHSAVLKIQYGRRT